MLEGDRALFSRLYLEHKSSLSYLCRRYLQDARDVDEVVQETFLKLFLALPDLESEAQVVAWSRRTATNLCIDRYRAAKRRPTMTDLEVLPEEFGAECDEDYLVIAEDAAIVREALADLPPLYRKALLAREVEGMALEDIAAGLEVEPAQMKHLLHRARRAMRRSLESRTGRAVAGLMAALLAIGSMATGVRFFSSDRSRTMGSVDANPLIDHSFDSGLPKAHVHAAPPVAPVVRKPATKPTVRVHHPVTHKPAVHVPAVKPPVVTKPVVKPPVSQPPVAKPPVVQPPTFQLPAGPAFAVEGGVAQSGTASVTQTGIAATPDGTSALSTFTAATANGALVIDQSVTQHASPVVWLHAVSLGGQALSLGQVLIERHVQADGSVAMTVFASVDSAGTAAAAGPTTLEASSFAVSAGSSAPTADLSAGQTPSAITISYVLAPGGSQVLYEHVAVAQA
jgi:RNA polymerase sigma-70 factor (ECF subfamily)